MKSRRSFLKSIAAAAVLPFLLGRIEERTEDLLASEWTGEFHWINVHDVPGKEYGHFFQRYDAPGPEQPVAILYRKFP